MRPLELRIFGPQAIVIERLTFIDGFADSGGNLYAGLFEPGKRNRSLAALPIPLLPAVVGGKTEFTFKWHPTGRMVEANAVFVAAKAWLQADPR